MKEIKNGSNSCKHTILLLIYKDNYSSHQIYKNIMGYSIFVQYFGVIGAFIRHILMNFSPQNAKSRALTHVYAKFDII